MQPATYIRRSYSTNTGFSIPTHVQHKHCFQHNNTRASQTLFSAQQHIASQTSPSEQQHTYCFTNIAFRTATCVHQKYHFQHTNTCATETMASAHKNICITYTDFRTPVYVYHKFSCSGSKCSFLAS
jgi:hypothetical protein